MQQASEALPTPASATFAAMLSALAAPEKRRTTDWNDDGLADDVATLSYERALRAHSRYRPAVFDGQPVTQNAPAEQVDCYETLPAEEIPNTPLASLQLAHPSSPGPRPETSDAKSTLPENNLKRSSVTIRLTGAECSQLHARAAEAGLSLSAYMRSCTFEAESLRALVKVTLAELQSAKTGGKPPSHASARRSGLGWVSRLLPRGQSPQHIERA